VTNLSPHSYSDKGERSTPYCKPSDDDWRAIQATVDQDCPLGMVADLGEGRISWDQAAERICAYAEAAFARGRQTVSEIAPSESEHYELLNELDHRGRHIEEGELGFRIRETEWKVLRRALRQTRSASGETNRPAASAERQLGSVGPLLPDVNAGSIPAGSASFWKDLATKMREIWVRRVHELDPPLTDEEISWADEWVDAIDSSANTEEKLT